MSSEEDQKPAARQDFVPPKTESLRRRKEEDDTEVHATVSATRFARVTGGAPGETNKQKSSMSSNSSGSDVHHQGLYRAPVGSFGDDDSPPRRSPSLDAQRAFYYPAPWHQQYYHQQPQYLNYPPQHGSYPPAAAAQFPPAPETQQQEQQQQRQQEARPRQPPPLYPPPASSYQPHQPQQQAERPEVQRQQQQHPAPPQYPPFYQYYQPYMYGYPVPPPAAPRPDLQRQQPSNLPGAALEAPPLAQAAVKGGGDDGSISPPSPPQVLRTSPLQKLRPSPTLSFGLSPTDETTEFSPVDRSVAFEDDKTKLQSGGSIEQSERFEKDAAFEGKLALPRRSPVTKDGPKLKPRMSEVQPRNIWLEGSAKAVRGGANVRRLTMGGSTSNALEGINSMMRDSASEPTKPQAAPKKKSHEKERPQGDQSRPAQERSFPPQPIAPASHYFSEEAPRRQQSIHMPYQPVPPGFYGSQPYPHPQYGRPTSTSTQSKLPPTFEPPPSGAAKKQAPPSYRPTSNVPSTPRMPREYQEPESARIATSARGRPAQHPSIPSATKRVDSKQRADEAKGKEIHPLMSPPEKRTPCNCKKSKCLKMYCECFANQLYCEGCNCQDCNNNENFASIREKALKEAIAKNKSVFEQRSTGQTVGCKCKRSECLKKYCECFQAGVICSDKCKCVSCSNRAGSQKLIDKRRKMKDTAGAEYAMKIAQELWKQPKSARRGIDPQFLPQRQPMASPGGLRSPATSVPRGFRSPEMPVRAEMPHPQQMHPGSQSHLQSSTGGFRSPEVPVRAEMLHPQQQVHPGSQSHLQSSMPPPPYGSRPPPLLPPAYMAAMMAGMGFSPMGPGAPPNTPTMGGYGSHPPLPPFGTATTAAAEQDTSTVPRVASKRQIKEITPASSTPARRTHTTGIRLDFDPASSRKKRRKRNRKEKLEFFFGREVPAQPKLTPLTVFSFLSNQDIFSASLVCKDWSKMAMDKELWKFDDTK